MRKVKKKKSNKVKITSITYRRIKNLGNYENEQIEATALVSGGNVDVEAAKLKRWVIEKLALNDEVDYFDSGNDSHSPTCICDECM